MADRRRRRPQTRPRPRRREAYEFKADPKGTSFLKKLYLTRLQRLQLLKWGLYTLVCLVLLVIQDVILSQWRLFGATTDLAACILLLIGIYEGMENGGMFVLIGSLFYWFSGSAPGPYVIALLTFLTVGAAYVRQSLWNRGFGSVALCTAAGLLVYELALFSVGLFLGLTIWSRALVFMLTAGYSCALLPVLYPLVNSIAKIGGDTWKE